MRNAILGTELLEVHFKVQAINSKALSRYLSIDCFAVKVTQMIFVVIVLRKGCLAKGRWTDEPRVFAGTA